MARKELGMSGSLLAKLVLRAIIQVPLEQTSFPKHTERGHQSVCAPVSYSTKVLVDSVRLEVGAFRII